MNNKLKKKFFLSLGLLILFLNIGLNILVLSTNTLTTLSIIQVCIQFTTIPLFLVIIFDLNFYLTFIDNLNLFFLSLLKDKSHKELTDLAESIKESDFKNKYRKYIWIFINLLLITSLIFLFMDFQLENLIVVIFELSLCFGMLVLCKNSQLNPKLFASFQSKIHSELENKIKNLKNYTYNFNERHFMYLYSKIENLYESEKKVNLNHNILCFSSLIPSKIIKEKVNLHFPKILTYIIEIYKIRGMIASFLNYTKKTINLEFQNYTQAQSQNELNREQEFIRLLEQKEENFQNLEQKIENNLLNLNEDMNGKITQIKSLAKETNENFEKKFSEEIFDFNSCFQTEKSKSQEILNLYLSETQNKLKNTMENQKDHLKREFNNLYTNIQEKLDFFENKMSNIQLFKNFLITDNQAQSLSFSSSLKLLDFYIINIMQSTPENIDKVLNLFIQNYEKVFTNNT